jgi:TRAP-type C4-dicarboxylate transport system permease large subunit
MTLFVTSNISGISLNKLSKAVVPFAIVAFVITFVLAFLPNVVLAIPKALGILAG